MDDGNGIHYTYLHVHVCTSIQGAKYVNYSWGGQWCARTRTRSRSTHFLFLSDVLGEVAQREVLSGVSLSAAEPQLGPVEVPEGVCAPVGGEPWPVQLQGRDGVLHHLALEAREPLRAGHVPWVVVLVV